MNGNLPSPAVRFLKRQAGIVTPSFVEELLRSIWQAAPDQGGDRIDNPLEVAVRLIQLVQCLLQILVRIPCLSVKQAIRIIRIQRAFMVWVQPTFSGDHHFSMEGMRRPYQM